MKMAERFGRNKRRRARLELATQVEIAGGLAVALESSRGQLHNSQSELKRLRREIFDAKRIAGAMSVLFPATKRSVLFPARSSIHDDIRPPMSYVADDALMPTSVVQWNTLRVMLSKISPEALSRATHIRVHFGDGQWGYAVSEYAMHSMPTDFLVREVTSHLAESIGNQLAHAKQAGGRTQ